MQLLLIRHAKPQSSIGDGLEPNLSYDGNEQARRLPDALSKFSLARIVSSPRLQALQTAAPVADQLGMTVEIDDRFAEHNCGMAEGTSVEQASCTDRRLPGEVDVEGFVERVKRAIDDVIASGEHGQTVAVFTHSGVINAMVHAVMKTEELFSVQPDYAGVTRLLVSEDGGLSVASVNVTEHVWDLLYRTQWWSEEH
ncbi:histidine phosphatase family protein [Mycobacterium sp. E2479]|uniref:histidine phosphatase family protein n=1 Tax=Mycobacterium sp. E2479 TaxID=1834134 RepID=UPI0007FF66B8|nr:histidine phosphatase family protein [Mycobacterium sp. E2479]OBH50431.1 phosphoglycerate kinase [Mycobacterium sp. E2479]